MSLGGGFGVGLSIYSLNIWRHNYVRDDDLEPLAMVAIVAYLWEIVLSNSINTRKKKIWRMAILKYKKYLL